MSQNGAPVLYTAVTGATEFVPWCLDKKIGEGFLKYTPEYGDLAPGRIGNGTLEYDVPLAGGAFRRGAISTENLACRAKNQTGPAVQAKDAALPGTFVIRMPSSYVYLSGALTFQAVVPVGGEVAVEFSDNNGLDWKPVTKVAASGDRKIDLKPLVFRRYDYRLKFILKGQGVGLDALRIAHDVQHSQRALPALSQGPNTITFSADPNDEGTITVEGSVDPTVKGKQLTCKDFHARLNGLADLPFDPSYSPSLRVTGAKGSVTFPVTTPGDMVRLRFGGHYGAVDEADGWDLQVSFDGGEVFKTAARCAGPGVGAFFGGASKYVTVPDIPPGARSALVRWSGTRGNATRLYDYRIDADYKEPRGGFRPVRVTYKWEEAGQLKRHVHVARKANETYRIDCAAKPEMRAIVLELVDSD